MNVGFFGGTFDPVHNGHVAMAEASLRDGGLDRLILIPAGSTVHKPVDRVTSAGLRYTMCRLAFSENKRIEVSKTEVLRDGGSYTIDTIRELKLRLDPEDELFLVCGADILFDILKWRFPENIMRETAILASLRPGHDRTAFEARAEFLRDQYGARIRFFEAEQIDVSSTDIRNAAARGLDIDRMVPAAVAGFIRESGLYTPDDPLDSLSASELERLRETDRILLGFLDGYRLKHSLLTMTTAAHLAKVNGLDVFPAALAGLVHDCAKTLPSGKARVYVDPSDAATLAEPRLYHGPAGAALAQEAFRIDDPVVLDAIRYHSTGHAGMSKLDLIVYLADKGEPSRHYPEAERILKMAEENLENAFLESATIFDEFLTGKGKQAHPDTLAAIHDLERRTRIDH